MHLKVCNIFSLPLDNLISILEFLDVISVVRLDEINIQEQFHQNRQTWYESLQRIISMIFIKFRKLSKRCCYIHSADEPSNLNLKIVSWLCKRNISLNRLKFNRYITDADCKTIYLKTKKIT